MGIFERYEDRGLKILTFPCSQFMQEPKSNEQIRKFVDSFDVNYDIFAKVKVVCCGRHPLFSFLARKLGSCRWNFTKYLIDKKGAHGCDSASSGLPWTWSRTSIGYFRSLAISLYLYECCRHSSAMKRVRSLLNE